MFSSLSDKNSKLSFFRSLFILSSIFTLCVTQVIPTQICPPARQVRYVTTAAIERFKTLFSESDIVCVLDGSCDVNAVFDIFSSTCFFFSKLYSPFKG